MSRSTRLFSGTITPICTQLSYWWCYVNYLVGKVQTVYCVSLVASSAAAHQFDTLFFSFWDRTFPRHLQQAKLAQHSVWHAISHTHTHAHTDRNTHLLRCLLTGLATRVTRKQSAGFSPCTCLVSLQVSAWNESTSAQSFNSPCSQPATAYPTSNNDVQGKR